MKLAAEGNEKDVDRADMPCLLGDILRIVSFTTAYEVPITSEQQRRERLTFT